MEATDDRFFQMNYEEEYGIAPPIINEAENELLHEDLLLFFFWLFYFHPSLLLGCCVFYAISQYEIDEFDLFEDLDPSNLIVNFSPHVMIGVGMNIGVEETTLAQQESNQNIHDELIVNDRPDPPLIPFPHQTEFIATTVDDNNHQTNNLDPVDDLRADIQALLSDWINRIVQPGYRRMSSDSGYDADNDSSNRSDEDSERNSMIQSSETSFIPTTTNDQSTSTADTRMIDTPSVRLPSVQTVRTRRKSHRQASIISPETNLFLFSS